MDIDCPFTDGNYTWSTVAVVKGGVLTFEESQGARLHRPAGQVAAVTF